MKILEFDLKIKKGVDFQAKNVLMIGKSDLNEISLSDNNLAVTNDDGEIFIGDFESMSKMD